MTASTGATYEATERYASRVVEDGRGVPDHFRSLDGLRVSTVGLGTYLGEADDATDLIYTEAILEAIKLGCNFVDSAINYRFQRSERAIGVALERLSTETDAERSEIVVATKVGYVPFDGTAPSSPSDFKRYLETQYWEPGICSPSDMTNGFQHCMAPAYIEHHLSLSLENLGVDSIDVYYIHNPEGQLSDVDRPTFEARLEAAFTALENEVERGRIARYGVATWNGLRVAPTVAEFLGLERLVEIATGVAGDRHHFKVVQLPYNLAMPEAFAYFNQPVAGELVSTLQACQELGVTAVGSATLLQSRLTGELPPEVVSAFEQDESSQNAIQFARSTPGLTSALVGMSRAAHVRENLELAKVSPAPPEEFMALFESP